MRQPDGRGDHDRHGRRRRRVDPKVRERGGKTIAESVETAIIFGMPNEAIKTGAVDEVLPLHEIPGAIRKLCTG
jgi:chemotaxis response regulator CheB